MVNNGCGYHATTGGGKRGTCIAPPGSCHDHTLTGVGAIDRSFEIERILSFSFRPSCRGIRCTAARISCAAHAACGRTRR